MKTILFLSTTLVYLSSNLIQYVSSHGRLIEPPSRATMWRYGFQTPPNYNDHELYCGGFSRQYNKNKGKCGICGDPWDSPKPRKHEAGGMYGNGVIVRRYRMDSSINIRVELTANHKGYFEFRLCPNNNPHKVATQECLDLYILKLARRGNVAVNQESAIEHDARYFPGAGSKIFEMKYQLPKNLTCSQCVLQWRYIAGNNWGMCSNGTGMVGCGPQEEFRACADVAIVDSTGAADETPFDNEIEDDEEPTKPEEGIEHKAPSEWWLIIILIMLSTLLLALTVFMLIYLYYYKRTAVKEWWEEARLPSTHPDEKQSYFSSTMIHPKSFRFWRSDSVSEQKQKNFTLPQPIPPPRVKRGVTNEGFCPPHA